MTRKLTRRQTLKLIAAATTTAVLSPRLHARAWYPGVRQPQMAIPPEPATEDAWLLYGRAIYSVAVYREPATSSERLGAYARDQSFRIVGETHAPFSAHNDLWYELEEGGYVHSAWVLPIRVYPPQPFITELGPWGFWGEVSQIYTEARTAPSMEAGRRYRFYGGTVFYVAASQPDEAGTGWYKVMDDYPPRQNTNHQWVLARDIRRIPRAEMTPIHPFVGDKRIVIDIGTQSLTCYEGETEVFRTLVASGLGGGLATPPGEHCVLLKQPSRHMANTPYAGITDAEVSSGDIFDLPGVPWNVFFTLEGEAIHGAYWHNDFGVRRSHGCVNVGIDAARWIYRWTHPIGGYEDDFVQSHCGVGTPIIVK